MATFRWQTDREALVRRDVAAHFSHFLPGSQFVQSQPALAQVQLRTLQVEPNEQMQQGSSRARDCCRFALPQPWEYPAFSCWATDKYVLFERKGGAGPAYVRN